MADADNSNAEVVAKASHSSSKKCIFTSGSVRRRVGERSGLEVMTGIQGHTIGSGSLTVVRGLSEVDDEKRYEDRAGQDQRLVPVKPISPAAMPMVYGCYSHRRSDLPPRAKLACSVCMICQADLWKRRRDVCHKIIFCADSLIKRVAYLCLRDARMLE